MVLLPTDQPEMWQHTPLSGHICCMRFGEEKRYWNVERLITLSAALKSFPMKVDEAFEKIKGGRWFGVGHEPTVENVAAHMMRAIGADLKFPIILTPDGHVMDGAHRIVGAKLKNIQEVLAVQFTSLPEPDFIELNTDD